jgi:excisionase family DNA binding protein
MSYASQSVSGKNIHHSDQLLTNDQAAEYLGITPRTLEIWRCTKRYPIPFIKVGRLVRYRKSALDAFHVSRTVGED